MNNQNPQGNPGGFAAPGAYGQPGQGYPTGPQNPYYNQQGQLLNPDGSQPMLNQGPDGDRGLSSMAAAMASGGHGSGGKTGMVAAAAPMIAGMMSGHSSGSSHQSGGKIGMATAAAPVIAGMMSGSHGHNPGQAHGHGYGQGQIPNVHEQSGMHSGGKIAAAGAIAAAGMSYYEAHKAKKHQKFQTAATKKGVSVDSYIHRANEKEHKKAAKKAKKLGISPDQYMANQARDYNAKMTKLYGPFNGTLPAALLEGKGKKAKKNKKAKKRGSGSSSGSDSSSGSSGSDSD